MSKRIVILLIAVLVLGIGFARQAEAKTMVKQSPASVSDVSPLPMPSSIHPSTLDVDPFPKVPDIVILNPLTEDAAGYFWMRLSNCQRQIYVITHSGHGNALAGTAYISSKLTQLRQSESASPVSLSGSLSSLSPPGLIPRL